MPARIVRINAQPVYHNVFGCDSAILGVDRHRVRLPVASIVSGDEQLADDSLTVQRYRCLGPLARDIAQRPVFQHVRPEQHRIFRGRHVLRAIADSGT
jgi:hypothetical protein